MNQKIRLFTVVFLFVILVGGTAIAQDVNFSGIWKLDTEKSDFQMFRNRPDMDINMTYEITHEGEKIIIKKISKMPRGERTTEFTYTTDGKECVNETFRGGESVSTCIWENNTLVINTEQEFQRRRMGGMMRMSVTEKYSLSEDGKTLTVKTIRETPRGKMENTYVFNKIQPPSPPK